MGVPGSNRIHECLRQRRRVGSLESSPPRQSSSNRSGYVLGTGPLCRPSLEDNSRIGTLSMCGSSVYSEQQDLTWTPATKCRPGARMSPVLAPNPRQQPRLDKGGSTLLQDEARGGPVGPGWCWAKTHTDRRVASAGPSCCLAIKPLGHAAQAAGCNPTWTSSSKLQLGAPVH